MPLSNKAIALKKLRELKEIFKGDQSLILIERYSNYREVPFGFIIIKKGGLSQERIEDLKTLGFHIVQIDNEIKDNAVISYIQVYRHEIERESGWDNSFEDFSYSDFYRTSREEMTEEYWLVKYKILAKENSEYWHKRIDSEKIISNLQKEIQKLNEENHLLLKQLHRSSSEAMAEASSKSSTE